ncbi:YceI family protein [Rhizobium aegyptiacum]|uniref:YceI family protein n=1 Tax=Rhizobium aegyptiacum TaxID=1764550 RepID=UPI0012E8C6F3|nr:YceI family protein [Rhizobium aegyptiacum]
MIVTLRLAPAHRCLLFSFSLAMALITLLVAKAHASDAPQWQIEDAGRIGFVVRQADAPITGNFERFNATIRFDPKNLDGSHIAVEIEVGSVNTLSSDRDQMIRAADFFDAARWPTARFQTTRIVSNGGDHYEAHGQLTIRNVTQEIILPFDLTIDEHPDDPGALQAVAMSELPIRRLGYGVGQGQWSDTSVVADEVVIQIEIRAQRPKD